MRPGKHIKSEATFAEQTSTARAAQHYGPVMPGQYRTIVFCLRPCTTVRPSTRAKSFLNFQGSTSFWTCSPSLNHGNTKSCFNLSRSNNWAGPYAEGAITPREKTLQFATVPYAVESICSWNLFNLFHSSCIYSFTSSAYLFLTKTWWPSKLFKIDYNTL